MYSILLVLHGVFQLKKNGSIPNSQSFFYYGELYPNYIFLFEGVQVTSLIILLCMAILAI